MRRLGRGNVCPPAQHTLFINGSLQLLPVPKGRLPFLHKQWASVTRDSRPSLSVFVATIAVQSESQPLLARQTLRRPWLTLESWCHWDATSVAPGRVSLPVLGLSLPPPGQQFFRFHREVFKATVTWWALSARWNTALCSPGHESWLCPLHTSQYLLPVTRVCYHLASPNFTAKLENKVKCRLSAWWNIIWPWKGRGVLIHCCNLGKSWKHDAKWKKPIRKDFILYNFSVWDV